jgi:hypothetical protein
VLAKGTHSHPLHFLISALNSSFAASRVVMTPLCGGGTGYGLVLIDRYHLVSPYISL